MDDKEVVKEIKEELKQLKELKTAPVAIISTSLYWLMASFLIVAKVLGYSTLNWFWTLIPITWPFILSFGFFGIVLAGGILMLILAVLFFGCIEIHEYVTKRIIEHKKKETKKDE